MLRIWLRLCRAASSAVKNFIKRNKEQIDGKCRQKEKEKNLQAQAPQAFKENPRSEKKTQVKGPFGQKIVRKITPFLGGAVVYQRALSTLCPL